MQQNMAPWIVALVLSVLSMVVISLSSGRPGDLETVAPDEGSIELASVGEAETVDLQAEIVGEEQGDVEMVVYSTADASTGDSGDLAMVLPDGETVTLGRDDLALGKRIQVSKEAARRVQQMQSQTPDSAAIAVEGSFSMAMKMGVERHQQRIVLQEIGQEVTDFEELSGDGAIPELPAAAGFPPLILTLTVGPYRFAEVGGWEAPIYVIARRLLPDSDELAATPVQEAVSVLVEAAGREPRNVRIEAGRARSTDPVFVPLRRRQALQVTATDLEGEAATGRLEVSWQAHGPQSLVLKVYPSTVEGYATRLSPIQLSAHVELDEHRLVPGSELPLQASASKTLSVEPANAVLSAVGEPVVLNVLGHDDGTETLTLQVPDLDLEAEVMLTFRRPYLFLGLAALFGALGVIVARRKQLFEQGRRAVTLELLAAAMGGVLLYAAFLMQWLPAPGFLIGALPASAVGVLGGYGGEAVFQGIFKLTGLSR